MLTPASKIPLLVIGIVGLACLSAFAFFNRRPAPPAVQGARQGEAGGLFRVRKNGQTAFIDNTGKVVIPPRPDLNVPDYGKYPDFAEGLAQVEVETDEPGLGGLGKR